MGKSLISRYFINFIRKRCIVGKSLLVCKKHPNYDNLVHIKDTQDKISLKVIIFLKI